jgi:hypothetical protein
VIGIAAYSLLHVWMMMTTTTTTTSPQQQRWYNDQTSLIHSTTWIQTRILKEYSPIQEYHYQHFDKMKKKSRRSTTSTNRARNDNNDPSNVVNNHIQTASPNKLVSTRQNATFDHLSTTTTTSPKRVTSLQQQQQQQKQHHHQQPQQQSQSLRFIPAQELRQRDFFSDSWLINKQRLLEIDPSRIQIVEDAAFAAVGSRADRPYPYSKQTYDWLDFCVEHLSKWWGGLQILSGGDPGNVFNHTIGMMETFMTQKVRPPALSSSATATTPLHPTIGMIAFAPYQARSTKHDPTGAKSRRLTAYSLAATMASLYQVGFGRVIVVGIHEHDIFFIQDAVDILKSIYNTPHPRNETTNTRKDKTDENTMTKLGLSQMEINFVHVTDPDWISTGSVATNIPRAAVMGMRLALSQKLNKTETAKWLGSRQKPSYWKYIYLTEPDTILHIRPELLPSFQSALDRGLSLFPHRLHPLPHETDLPQNHTLNPGVYLPNVGHFSNITILDTSEQAQQHHYADGSSDIAVSCCDDGKVWPGEDGWDKKKECGPWWTCGFHRIDLDHGEVYNETELLQKHKALQLYPMMVSV